MYINTETLVQATEQEIRQAYPNISFQYPFTPPDNYMPVFPTPQPEYDTITQVVYQVAPELTSKGHWEQRWEIRSKFTEYVQDGVTVTVAEQEKAALAIAAQQAQQLMIAQFDAALTNHLDQTAQAKRYDNRISCALRAGYDGPFKAEGVAFAAWMDTCNASAYKKMAAVLSGQEQIPTVDEFIASLPAIVWPE